MAPIFKNIDNYIRSNLKDCSFVGVSNDGELFVDFSTEDVGYREKACALLLENLASDIKKIIIVEKLDIKRATELLDALNNVLDEDTVPNLITISGF